MTADKLIPPSPSEEAYAADQDQGDVFTDNDPFALFAEWLALAKKTEPNDPNSMALATVDAQGMPDVRMVLLKDFDTSGLTFTQIRKVQRANNLLRMPEPRSAFTGKPSDGRCVFEARLSR